MSDHNKLTMRLQILSLNFFDMSQCNSMKYHVSEIGILVYWHISPFYLLINSGGNGIWICQRRGCFYDLMSNKPRDSQRWEVDGSRCIKPRRRVQGN